MSAPHQPFQIPAAQGLYLPEYEKDSCGVGFIAHLKGKASQSIVNMKFSSVMCVPLLERGEMFGLLYVGSNRVLHQFDGRDFASIAREMKISERMVRKYVVRALLHCRSRLNLGGEDE